LVGSHGRCSRQNGTQSVVLVIELVDFKRSRGDISTSALGEQGYNLLTFAVVCLPYVHVRRLEGGAAVAEPARATMAVKMQAREDEEIIVNICSGEV
jgi:hypothetical protein